MGFGAHVCYIVSGGALNSTHSLTHLSCSHFSVRTRDLPLLRFQSVKFFKTNIAQGSVATLLTYGMGSVMILFIANFMLSVVKEFFLKIGQYIAAI